jgi:hypothetical protein
MTVKSKSGDCFSILVFLNLSLPEDRFEFTLYAGTRCYFLFDKHVLVAFLFYCFQHKKNNNKKKIGGEDIEFYFFF